MSQAEMITVMMAFHYNTFRNYKHYYCQCMLKNWKHLFPDAVSFNRFVELQPRCFMAMVMFRNLVCYGQCTGISFIDSTCITVIYNKREHSMRVFMGIAKKGKNTMGRYIGFKLHLVCNGKGEILNFMPTRANVGDRNENVFKSLTDSLFGKPYAVKGYIS